MISTGKCRGRPAQQEEHWARRNFMDFEYKLMLIAKDASEEGFEEGYKKGFEEGYKEGFEKGYKEGLREVRLSNYSSLVQDGVLSLSDAISLSDLSELEINGWIQAHSNT